MPVKGLKGVEAESRQAILERTFSNMAELDKILAELEDKILDERRGTIRAKKLKRLMAQKDQLNTIKDNLMKQGKGDHSDTMGYSNESNLSELTITSEDQVCEIMASDVSVTLTNEKERNSRIAIAEYLLEDYGKTHQASSKILSDIDSGSIFLPSQQNSDAKALDQSANNNEQGKGDHSDTMGYSNESNLKELTITSEDQVCEITGYGASVALQQENKTYNAQEEVAIKLEINSDSGKGTSDSDSDGSHCAREALGDVGMQESSSEKDRNDNSAITGLSFSFNRKDPIRDHRSSQSTCDETGAETFSLDFSEDVVLLGVNTPALAVSTRGSGSTGVTKMCPSTKLAIVFGASTITLGIAVGSVTLVCAKVPESLPAFLAINQVALLVAACSVVGALMLATLIAGVASSADKERVSPVLNSASSSLNVQSTAQQTEKIAA